MQLSESKLFTIEALNRIDGFVWPEDASFACAFNIVNGRNFGVKFYIEKPVPSNAIEAFKGALSKGDPTKVILGQHPDWRNSLITKSEFDSVDGWIRNDGEKILTSQLIDLRLKRGKVHLAVSSDEVNFEMKHDAFDIGSWRYHKPTKETLMPTKKPESKPEIHAIYESYKQQCETTADAQRALDASKEAEDAFLEQIKQWNLQYGFDVRLLDESEENQDQQENELVITDWRDLQEGDVVKAILVNGASHVNGRVGVVKRIDGSAADGPLFVKFDSVEGWWVKEWKFIRRPQ